METNAHKFAITIDSDMISITCYSSPANGGIFQAHKLLNLGKIISILFGEIKHEELKKLLNDLFKH